MYGLECQGRDNDAARQRVHDLIQLVGLGQFKNYYPRELSGGMQQRCNLVRRLGGGPRSSHHGRAVRRA
jgi:NitT/TauT family transport system ATP-binding protein